MIRSLIRTLNDEDGSTTIEAVMTIGVGAIAGVFLVKLGHAFIDWGSKIVQQALFS